MEYTQNTSLVLQFLEHNLDDPKDKPKGKGKQPAGNLKLAIAMMKNELFTTRTSIDDESLAVNTSTAIATVQNDSHGYEV